MGRLSRLSWAPLLAASLPVMAAQVHIPVPTGSAGVLGTLRANLRLVDAAGNPVIAFNGTGLATEYTNLSFGASGVTVTLAPQALLSLPSGDPTFYQLQTSWAGGSSKWLFQVADVGTVQELRDLVGAAAIDGEGLFVEMMASVHDDAVATAADRVQTGLDATATAADRVQTGLDAAATAADRVQTGLDKEAADADRVQTGLDRVQTGLDAIATAADRVQTGLDAVATAADRVQTGQDASATAADRVQTGEDAAATAADRATLEGVHLVTTLAMGSDTTPVEPGSATTWWAGAGQLAGMVCFVTSTPYGGNINLDLQYGNPWVSAYPVGETPYIAPGETDTLAHNSVALADPPTLTAMERVRVVVTSAPAETDLSGYVPTVADLSLYPPVGAKYGVQADGHVWLRTQVWTDLGIGWSNWVGDVVQLPTGIAAGVIYLVTADTHRYQSNGDNTWTDLGVAYTGTVETTADLQYVAPPLNTVYRVNDTSHRYQVTGDPWSDQGLAKSPGSGLRCLTYLYPYVP